ncbi:hypothetical protein Patl1_12654 [Pistacia atlantica]|uniref:Uncharacterized protein n=1 Tax=Pistacia atlantica TaxID=434234 RepID=A0ACC1AWM8_9ROSI|nr:hypothetical protein Patl1_12654 [Pistacia atlantica]
MGVLEALDMGPLMTSACFFLVIGFVIWVLEHKINEDFRGPLEHQVGISFWGESDKQFGLVEECDALFENGTANGGITTAFDEVPYIKLFLGKYCSKYTMVEPTFNTASFGFASSLNSLYQGKKLNKIEDAWFKKNSYPDPSTLVSSQSLDLNSLWGLFLIVGTASILALIIFVVTFVYEHREVMKESDPRSSLLTRIRTLLEIFVSRDLSAHTFKETTGIHVHGLGAATPSPNNHYPASPSSYSQSHRSELLFLWRTRDTFN